MKKLLGIMMLTAPLVSCIFGTRDSGIIPVLATLGLTIIIEACGILGYTLLKKA